MAIAVDPQTRVITILQADLTFISGVIWELDVNWFRLALKDWEDDPENIAMPTTHNHGTQLLLSGITYARSVEIINGYTVTFEDMGPHYTVRCVGANHNLADVLNFNVVNLIINNSAGLVNTQLPASPQEVADAVRLELAVELANLDATVTSRLADIDYTAPPAVSAFWQHVVESGLTAEQMLRLLASVAAGNATGLDASPVFRDLANTKNRVAGTVTGTTRTISSRDGT